MRVLFKLNKFQQCNFKCIVIGNTWKNKEKSIQYNDGNTSVSKDPNLTQIYTFLKG